MGQIRPLTPSTPHLLHKQLVYVQT